MKLFPHRKVSLYLAKTKTDSYRKNYNFAQMISYKFKYHSKTPVYAKNRFNFFHRSLINIVNFIVQGILCANHTFLQQNLTLKKVNPNKRNK